MTNFQSETMNRWLERVLLVARSIFWGLLIGFIFVGVRLWWLHGWQK